MAWDRGKIDWGMQKYGVPNPENVERWGEAGKGSAVALLQDGLALPEVLGTCKFYMYGGVTVDHWAEMVSALTGWEIDGRELLKISERVLNLQRMFNVREGITRKDDLIPPRVRALPSFGKYASEPAVEVVDMEGMLDEYYLKRGWDRATGIPTQEKLKELDLG
jgi:aldehyde:ferredoxin oxidoreductase